MTLEEMKRLKAEKGYTLSQLSEYSQVPLGTLQKIFTGETAHPRYATRQAIERVLGGEQAAPNRYDPAKDGHIPMAYQFDHNALENLPDCVREAAYDAGGEKRQGEYTLEDYYAWPKEQRVELIDGTIYVMEAPGFVHQRIASEMLFAIKCILRKKGNKDKIKRWGIMGAPDFILEILSQTSRRKDCTKKLQKYCDAGVKEYWILDPQKKMLLTYDFMHDNMPCFHPLTGTAGLALYGGELRIDLDEIAGLIQDWPE